MESRNRRHLAGFRGPLRNLILRATERTREKEKEAEEGCYCWLPGEVVIFSDDGATEALRWMGGIRFLRNVVSQNGSSSSHFQSIYNLHDFDPRRQRQRQRQGHRRPPHGQHGAESGLFLLTRFVWDMEDSILCCARTLGLRHVVIASSLSEEAHSSHPHVAHLASDTMGQPSFQAMAANLKMSLTRLFSIDAQSSPKGSGTTRFGEDHARSGSSSSSSKSGSHIPRISIVHCPLGALPIVPNLGSFTLGASIAASAFPLLPCRLRRGEGLDGDDLPRVASAGLSSPAQQLAPGDIPADLRLQYRLLSHFLSDALVYQMGLDVTGRTLAIGRTSSLVGSTVATTTEMLVQRARHSPGTWTGGLTEASLVLIDRTVDLATPSSHGGGDCPLLQRILDCLPRSGVSAATPEGEDGQSGFPPNLIEVGLGMPLLQPGGLGLPHDSFVKSSSSVALKAVGTFKCQLPPSLCHPPASDAGNLHQKGPRVDKVLEAVASLPEEEGHAVLCAALEDILKIEKCTLPPPRKRGMGAALFALLTSLCDPSDLPCLRHHAVAQLALAAVDALQRTAPQVMPSWEATRATERALLQAAREGASGDDLAQQLKDVMSRSDDGSSLEYLLILVLRAAALAPGPWSSSSHGSLVQAINAVAEAASKYDSCTGQEQEIDAEEAILWIREAVSLSASALHTPELQFLGLCSFEAAVEPPHSPPPPPSAQQRVIEDGEDDWDDWEGGEMITTKPPITTTATSTAAKRDEHHPVLCDTVVGRLASLLLRDSGRASYLPELRQTKAVNVAAVGFGLLSAGFNRITGGQMKPHKQDRIRPCDSPVLVLFVLGGFTPQELKEVNAIMKQAPAGSPQIILAGTTIASPAFMYSQIFRGGGRKGSSE